MQRLLAARSQKQSVTALLSSGIAILFQFALFLIVGVMLWAYYRVPSATFGRPDRIYPTFIVTPHAARNLRPADRRDSGGSHVESERGAQFACRPARSWISMCAFGRKPTNRRRMRLSRLATFVWALVLFGLAVLSLHKAGRVVEVGLQIASVAYGALLGVFLLGVLTRKAQSARRDGGHAVWIQRRIISVALDACPVDLVGHDWDDRDVCCGIRL